MRCILDEVNRAENEKVLNVLMPLVDHRRCVWVEELGREVRVAEGVIFYGTLNEGAYFAGTNNVDNALRDRFREITWISPPACQSQAADLPDGNPASLRRYPGKFRTEGAGRRQDRDEGSPPGSFWLPPRT